MKRLLRDIRACRICEAHLPHGVRPIIHASATARLCIIAQAPGIRVHETGISFNDPSGERLREWMGVDRDTFYDESRVAIIGMGFCFPGYDVNGGDLPPRKECAKAWQDKLFATLPQFPLTLLVGTYAFDWHLRGRAKRNVTETVKAWREYSPRYLPLPHPSWRNNAWLQKNPWFAKELLPYLRRRVASVIGSSNGTAGRS
ncbi:MAG: uracil-DNA glycosylase family protein [Alphaproteobacteria bacterium]|nr:uracil-DNA glycosylase family protein [Alphaproteobacteria bacterium]MDE1987713.1 uracil-DNA glycosylase family protein [Alphaproteobacteria bacterium]MDE2164323.1 uracil-DNA glycosylase family protein [Alphaproteobacteria bacterium]